MVPRLRRRNRAPRRADVDHVAHPEAERRKKFKASCRTSRTPTRAIERRAREAKEFRIGNRGRVADGRGGARTRDPEGRGVRRAADGLDDQVERAVELAGEVVPMGDVRGGERDVGGTAGVLGRRRVLVEHRRWRKRRRRRRRRGEVGEETEIADAGDVFVRVSGARAFG